jgi:hypothetical protein
MQVKACGRGAVGPNYDVFHCVSPLARLVYDSWVTNGQWAAPFGLISIKAQSSQRPDLWMSNNAEGSNHMTEAVIISPEKVRSRFGIAPGLLIRDQEPLEPKEEKISVRNLNFFYEDGNQALKTSPFRSMRVG